jgi:DHA1 family bicyclomycin/chloramphenicol resistance-like MFS transporter
MTTVTRLGVDRNGIGLTILLSLLLGFASISTDLYLPALPSMGESLGASQGMLELTVSGYLLGFSFGQLFWGPLSDRYGRKLPLLCGLIIFIIGALGCALSTDAWQMIGWRVVQAIGASSAVVLARAMVRDLFTGDQAARMLSTLMMIMGMAPMIGPTVGAQILAFSSWQAIFWTLVGIGLLTMVGVSRTAESLPFEKREQGSLLGKFAHYGKHMRNARLLAYAGVLGSYAVGVFAYVAGSPFLFISVHGLSSEMYGLVFASGIVGIMLSNGLNRRLVVRFGSDRILVAGTFCGVLAGFLVATLALTGWGGAVSIAAALFFYISMNGFIGANAIAGGLSRVGVGTGSASALLGFSQYGGGMVGSALVGSFANGTSAPLGIVVCLASLGAAVCAIPLMRQHQSDTRRCTQPGELSNGKA